MATTNEELEPITKWRCPICCGIGILNNGATCTTCIGTGALPIESPLNPGAALDAIRRAHECLVWHYNNPNKDDMLGIRQKLDAMAARRLSAMLNAVPRLDETEQERLRRVLGDPMKGVTIQTEPGLSWNESK